MTLTKSDLIDSIHNQCDQPKKASLTIVESILEIMKKTLESGEDIMISGFGKFCVKEKGDRKGRNPKTGENMMLNSRKVVTFRLSGVLKEKVNGNL